MRKLITFCGVAIALAGSNCFGQSDTGTSSKPADPQELRIKNVGYETIRFYTRNSKPENIGSYAFSPNGQYLALSFDRDNLGARSGLSIVDLGKRQLTNTAGHFSFFTMAFDSGSQRVLALGGYAGLQVYDVATNSIREIKSPEYVTGKIGINIEEKNGKLLISGVMREFNPTIGEQLQVGDELLAINEGEKPTRYDDRREWRTLIGKPLKYVLEELAGQPSTWIQLRLSRRGSSEPIDISVQRQWPVGYVLRRHPS